MTEEKVSVVMPVFNGEKTIRLALASLLLQTYKNWECIIVNDGSSDGTRAILDSLADSRFKVYHLDKNIGRSAARDVALSYVDGKYLSYLDADDMLHPNKLQLQVEYLRSHSDCSLVACGYTIIDDKLCATRVKRLTSDYQIVTPYKYGNSMLFLPHLAMVYVDKAKQISYNPLLDVGEDYDYFSRYLDGGKYAVLGVSLYYYFVGATTSKKLLTYQLHSFRMSRVFFRNRLYLKAFKHFVRRLFKLLCYMFILPFIDANTLVEKRESGCPLTVQEQDVYDSNLREIKKISQLLEL